MSPSAVQPLLEEQSLLSRGAAASVSIGETNGRQSHATVLHTMSYHHYTDFDASLTSLSHTAGLSSFHGEQYLTLQAMKLITTSSFLSVYAYAPWTEGRRVGKEGIEGKRGGGVQWYVPLKLCVHFVYLILICISSVVLCNVCVCCTALVVRYQQGSHGIFQNQARHDMAQLSHTTWWQLCLDRTSRQYQELEIMKPQSHNPAWCLQVYAAMSTTACHFPPPEPFTFTSPGD